MEIHRSDAYDSRMSSASLRGTTPIAWAESLVRSKTQIAAGYTVPLLPVLDRLRATAERLEAMRERAADGTESSVGE
jgi:hypothetical protein